MLAFPSRVLYSVFDGVYDSLVLVSPFPVSQIARGLLGGDIRKLARAARDEVASCAQRAGSKVWFVSRYQLVLPLGWPAISSAAVRDAVETLGADFVRIEKGEPRAEISTSLSLMLAPAREPRPAVFHSLDGRAENATFCEIECAVRYNTEFYGARVFSFDLPIDEKRNAEITIMLPYVLSVNGLLNCTSALSDRIKTRGIDNVTRCRILLPLMSLRRSMTNTLALLPRSQTVTELNDVLRNAIGSDGELISHVELTIASEGQVGPLYEGETIICDHTFVIFVMIGAHALLAGIVGKIKDQ